MKGWRLFPVLFLCWHTFAQPYLATPGKTRHRFAQTVFGIDAQGTFGGNSQLMTASGSLTAFTLKPQFSPRLYISGLHFWGHAEFYFSFQLFALNKNTYGGMRYTFSQSDIFGTKIYPWAVQNKKLRPYIGFSISGINYRQYNNSQEGSGPLKTQVKIPLLAGINYCRGRYLFELALSYNYNNSMHYYVTPLVNANIHTPSLLFSVGIRKWFETTAALEKNYRDGSTQKHYEALRRQKKLSSWFIGLGPSSAIFTQHFSFNRSLFPFMDKPLATIFPELSAGYYFQPLGMHVVAVARHNTATISAYGVTQKYKRTALTLEAHKYLFDYNGFDPFVGACLSYDWLGFSNTSANGADYKAMRQQLAPGLVFGWDILPDKLQGITLRTNMRYFPNLWLQPVPGKKVLLDQLEFNFIQLIVYPQRLKNFRKEYSRE